MNVVWIGGPCGRPFSPVTREYEVAGARKAVTVESADALCGAVEAERVAAAEGKPIVGIGRDWEGPAVGGEGAAAHRDSALADEPLRAADDGCANLAGALCMGCSQAGARGGTGERRADCEAKAEAAGEQHSSHRSKLDRVERRSSF
jgi:hypothetical protein